MPPNPLLRGTFAAKQPYSAIFNPLRPLLHSSILTLQGGNLGELICITNSSVPLCLRVQFIHPPNPLRRGTFAAKQPYSPIYIPPLRPPSPQHVPTLQGDNLQVNTPPTILPEGLLPCQAFPLPLLSRLSPSAPPPEKIT